MNQSNAMIESGAAFLDSSFHGVGDPTSNETDLPPSFVLQPVWELFLRNDYYTSSPLFPVFIGLGAFFLCVLPFTFLDFVCWDWPSIQQYRIRPSDGPVSKVAVSDQVTLTLWNQIMYILPVSIAQWVWTPPTKLPNSAPGVWSFFSEQLLCLMIYDAEIFVWHVIHHKNRFLFRRIHSVHHRYLAVNCWVSEYVHPWELFSVAVFATTAPWIVGAHPMTEWSFMALNAFLGVESHSGYNFPFFPHRWSRIYGGAVKHEMHHQRPLSNFQPYFKWFDWLNNSEVPGQTAGGKKPKALLEWEERRKRKE